MIPVLKWFHLNFGAGNFRSRRPGTSALRMLLRLTAVKTTPLPALSRESTMRDPGNKVAKGREVKHQLEGFLIDDVIVLITKFFCHRLLPGYQFSRASNNQSEALNGSLRSYRIILPFFDFS